MLTTEGSSQMAIEIAEQPEAVRHTLDALLPRRQRIAELATGRRHVLLVARGSSDNAAVYGRYLLETEAGMSAALAAPSVATHYRPARDLSDTLLISISQSGQTTEIVQTQEWAHANGAATIAVTNVDDSALAREADLALVTKAGHERAVPATKTYLTQLAAMAVLASALTQDARRFDAELATVPAEIGRLLARTDPEPVVERLAATTRSMVTGRGLVLGTAFEMALKLEETCLRPIRGLSYADLRHGPIAVISPGTAALLVSAQDGPLLHPMTELAADLRSRGASVVGIGGDHAFREACDLALAGPDLSERLAPLGLIVPGQMVVEALARRLGFDPDSPRGLAKITQTDRSCDAVT